MNSEPEKTGLRQIVKLFRTKPNNKASLLVVSRDAPSQYRKRSYFVFALERVAHILEALTFNP